MTKKRSRRSRKQRKQRQTRAADARAASPVPLRQLPGAVKSIVERGLTVRAYAVRAASWRADDRSFEAVIATETPVEVYDFREWELIDEVVRLDGMRGVPNGQVPLCDTHDRSTIKAQLGSCREIRADGPNLMARNFISEAEPDAALKVSEGHVTDCSIGYRVRGYVDIQPGETLEVKGKSYTASPDKRLRISYDWELVENSLVPVGADALAKIREKPKAPGEQPAGDYFQQEDKRMKDFRDWAEDAGFEPDELTDAQGQTLRRLYDAERASASAEASADKADEPAGDPPEEPVGQTRELTDGERLRADVMAMCPTDLKPFAERMLLEEKDLTADGARAKLLAEVTKRQAPVGTPEPPDPPAREKKDDGQPPDKLADVADRELKRGLTG